MYIDLSLHLLFLEWDDKCADLDGKGWLRYGPLHKPMPYLSLFIIFNSWKPDGTLIYRSPVCSKPLCNDYLTVFLHNKKPVLKGHMNGASIMLVSNYTITVCHPLTMKCVVVIEINHVHLHNHTCIFYCIINWVFTLLNPFLKPQNDTGILLDNKYKGHCRIISSSWFLRKIYVIYLLSLASINISSYF